MFQALHTWYFMNYICKSSSIVLNCMLSSHACVANNYIAGSFYESKYSTLFLTTILHVSDHYFTTLI